MSGKHSHVEISNPLLDNEDRAKTPHILAYLDDSEDEDNDDGECAASEDGVAEGGGALLLLRLEDLDLSRCKPRFARDLYRDLKWLHFFHGQSPCRADGHVAAVHLDPHTSFQCHSAPRRAQLRGPAYARSSARPPLPGIRPL